MRLIEALSEWPTRPAVPLVGYPGITATQSTAESVLNNRDDHIDALMFLSRRFNPPCLFHVMDLTVEAEALGLAVKFCEDGPPSIVEHPIGTLEQLGSLSVPDPGRDGRLPLFIDVVGRTALGIDGLMGAYCVGPFTLAAELCGAEELAVRTITDVGFVEDMMSFVTLVCQTYARALAAAGARVVVVLEPTAVILSPASFGKYCLGPLRAVAAAARDRGACPVLHICGDTSALLPPMVAAGFDGLSLDAPVDLADALALAPDDMVVLGNIDPVSVMLEGGIDDVSAAVTSLLERFGARPNFTLATGCDLPMETPLENIDAFMDTAKSFKP